MFLQLLIVIASAIGNESEHSQATVTRARVDMIELNHFIDEDGREVFRQIVFYDWSKSRKRFHVRAWRLIKQDSQLPQRRWNPTLYECSWHDEGVLRQVWAPTMRETWTQRDPERVNRTLLPEDQRKPLFPPAQKDTRSDTASR